MHFFNRKYLYLEMTVIFVSLLTMGASSHHGTMLPTKTYNIGKPPVTENAKKNNVKMRPTIRMKSKTITPDQ